MHDGFLRVAAVSPDLRVADPSFNAREIARMAKQAEAAGARLIAFPEMCLTGYTAGDLFLLETLARGVLEALEELLSAQQGSDAIWVIGLPVAWENRLYNCAAVLQGGRILGVVPKTHLPNYQEFYELRQFAPGFSARKALRILG